MTDDLLVVLTVRAGSERLPGKALAEVAGRPLLAWLVERLSPLGCLVVATTGQPEDDEVERVARAAGAETYRHEDPDDVAGRVWAVLRKNPAAFCLRALGDCPFVELALVRRALAVMRRAKADLFYWTGDNVSPVYGAREFPWSVRVWARVAEAGRDEEREHPALYVDRNRAEWQASTVYHDPPPSVYFRPPQEVRLEVDHPEDLELVRAVAGRGPGMLAPLAEVVRWLDGHPEAAALNRHLPELTGPIVSHGPAVRRGWHKLADPAPVWTWDGEVVRPLSGDRSARICCEGCGHVLGWGQGGVFHLRADGGASGLTNGTGVAMGQGRARCPNCGRTRVWARPK